MVECGSKVHVFHDRVYSDKQNPPDRRVCLPPFDSSVRDDDNAESEGEWKTLISKRDDENELLFWPRCERRCDRSKAREPSIARVLFFSFAFLLTITDWGARFSSGKEVPTRRVASGTALVCPNR